jgi:hypothetical protein
VTSDPLAARVHHAVTLAAAGDKPSAMWELIAVGAEGSTALLQAWALLADIGARPLRERLDGELAGLPPGMDVWPPGVRMAMRILIAQCNRDSAGVRVLFAEALADTEVAASVMEHLLDTAAGDVRRRGV